MEDVKDTSVSTEEVVEGTTPGSKTDSSLLLKSLQEERELRRKEQEEKTRLERELLELKSNASAPEVFSDEGIALQKKFEAEIQAIKESQELKDLKDKYSALKDKSAEFDEFRKNYPSVSLEAVAKVFMAENDLYEPKFRKGLESSGGGGRAPIQTGMTAEDVANLRNTNYRKYVSLVKEGKIKVG